MLDECPVKMKVGQFTLEGFSIAGYETCIRVAELNVCFDLGRAPRLAVQSPVVLLSHAHQDHIAGVGYYFSNRNFRGMSTGKVILPEGIRGDVSELMRVWRKLEGYKIPYQLKGVRAGQRFKIRPRTEAMAFATDHLVPSLGYCLLDMRQKLLPKYEGLPPERIQQIARGGKRVSHNVRVPIITYLGDTQLVDLQAPAVVLDSDVLLVECTFLTSEHRTRAAAGKHVHVKDLAAFLETVRSKHIVLHHFSSRYRRDRIASLVAKGLPSSVMRRVRLLLPPSPPRMR